MGLISSIFPDNAQCNDPGGLLTLQVRGSGFIGADQVSYDGSNVATTFVSATLLTITLNPPGASRPRYVPITVPGDTTVKRFCWTPEAIPGGSKSWYPPTP